MLNVYIKNSTQKENGIEKLISTIFFYKINFFTFSNGFGI